VRAAARAPTIRIAGIATPNRPGAEPAIRRLAAGDRVPTGIRAGAMNDGPGSWFPNSESSTPTGAVVDVAPPAAKISAVDAVGLSHKAGRCPT
jgi:hypothetical protein